MLDALEKALYARKPFGGDRLIHHSGLGSQSVGIRYTKRLAEAGLEPSVGNVGNAYENALAGSIIDLYVEADDRNDWFNHRRLLEPVGNIPPAEAEAAYYSHTNEFTFAA